MIVKLDPTDIAKQLETMFRNHGFDPKTPYNQQIVEALTEQCKFFGAQLLKVSFGPHDSINVEVKLPSPGDFKIDIDLSDDGKCKHDLKPYYGFRESYLFCTKCPHKEYPQ